MSYNKLIERELSKLTVAKLNNYDEKTNTYFIPKYEPIKFVQGKEYLVKLDKVLLSKTGNSILVNNWNKGTFPTSEYLKIHVNKLLNDKINVASIYYNFETKQDLEEEWMGWLPITNIEIVKCL